MTALEAPTAEVDKCNTAWRLFVLLLVSTSSVMAGAALAPSLVGMEKEYAEEDNVELKVRLVVSLSPLVIALLSPIAGHMEDKIGRTRPLNTALGMMGLVGALPLFFDAFYAVMFSRFVVGCSISMSIAATNLLVADYYTGEKRAAVIGYQSTTLSIGFFVFVTLAGWLASFDWRYPFAMYWLCLVYLPLSMHFLNDPARPKKAQIISKIDLQTSLKETIVASDAKLIESNVEQTNENDNENASGTRTNSVIVCAAVGSSAPVHMRHSTTTVVITCFAVAFFYNVASYAMISEIPFLVDKTLKTPNSTVYSGLLIGLINLVGAATSSCFKQLIGYFKSHEMLLSLLCLDVAIGLVILSITPNVYVAFLCLFFVAAQGATCPCMIDWINSVVLPSKRGKNLGPFFSFWFAGSLLISAAVSYGVSTREIFMISAGVCAFIAIPVLMLWCTANKQVVDRSISDGGGDATVVSSDNDKVTEQVKS